MDNLRGDFHSNDLASDSQDWDAHEEEETARDLPPEAIGQDERRMQVRAYNHWASLLGDATFPSIEDLEPQNLDDFGPNSVLLDFSSGIEDPAVQFLGQKLADECGADGHIVRLSDVPPRSLLSRITDHYMQILANQAPIGFEAEFVNQRGASIMYRGILLPFSSDDETIDFIYGVINWKEMADQVTSDELLLEIDQALEAGEEAIVDEDEPQKHHADPVTDWAEAPGADMDLPDATELAPSDADASDLDADIFELNVEAQVASEVAPEALDPGDPSFDAGDNSIGSDNVSSLSGILGGSGDHDDLPTPDFGQYGLDDPEDEEDEEEGAGYSFASLSDYIEAPAKKAIDLDAEAFDPSDYEVEDTYDDPVDHPVDEDAIPVTEDPAFEDQAGSVEGEAPIADEPQGEIAQTPEPQPVEEPDTEEVVTPVVPPAQLAPVETSAVEATPAESTPIEEAPIEIGEIDPDAGIYDCLASARELAENARASEDRSRTALYAAVSRAYDFSLAAQSEPDEFAELLEESGLTTQDRAPMTPVVKLVFGSDYDKTRLTEYAAVLSHAHRHSLERGSLAEFLGKAEGGLKGVVKAERRLRKEEAGQAVEPENEVRRALAKKLRELEAMTFDALAADGAEFSLVMVRRDGEGGIAMVGEIDSDIPLIERAAKKLVG